ncbi:uncharacterized protein [Phaseolus vulgaris]|uniref:PHD-type domain-containing protein n=1 Tax=Phaseolus vulgaris TaxID=3885 RepID=V7AMG0_PHAVU|nr:hypothetical protein PHAVU_011G170000g [Phaseolus vulgaris]ESW05316.1 hypothetical protein PHAVU_011G170000g [Phaseolus vulgaris]
MSHFPFPFFTLFSMSHSNNPKMHSSTTFLHDLPPLKRLRLIQQQQDQQPHQNHFFHSSPQPHQNHFSDLPAKKRRESRTPSPPSATTLHNFSLPAKKRVWAPHPQSPSSSNDTVPTSETTPSSNDALPLPPAFDLNIEYNPDLGESENGGDDDDGVLCCVCQSTDGDPEDPIVFCDGCDLTVHASCYGHPLSKGVPDGDWFCERCRVGEAGESKGCALCPSSEGAMKRTAEGAWAHVVCALFVPEVFFQDPEGREGIDCSMVPKKRWSQRCYLCDGCDGCALVCSEPKCGLAFHVTCALKKELWIEYKEGKKGGTIVAGFCKTHTQIWEKQSGKYKIVPLEDEK